MTGQNAYIPVGAQHKCYSYRADRDIHSAACNFAESYMNISATTPDPSGNCPSWHYATQVPTGGFQPGMKINITSNNRLISIGPQRGGIYGCERMDMAHVWQYKNKSGQQVQFFPRVVPIPESVPVPPADVDTGLGPGRRPRPRPEPYEDPIISRWPKDHPVPEPYHKRVPPEPGMKEKKLKLGKGGLIGSVYGAVTEVVDALDAIGKALDPKVRGGYRQQKTVQDKIRYLLRNWRYIDHNAALGNIILDQVEDWFIGKSNQLANRTASHPYWRGMRGPNVSRMPGRIPAPQL